MHEMVDAAASLCEPSHLQPSVLVSLKAIRYWNTSILKVTLWSVSVEHREWEILEDTSMLIDAKSMLRVSDTLIPLIFMSNQTHLLKFAGDIEVLPVCMTIGNLSSMIHQMPSTHSIIIVALRPIPINICNSPQIQLHEQWQSNRQVQNRVHRQVLLPLTFMQNPCAKIGYYNILYEDDNFIGCKLVLEAWLADCHEYSNLHHVKQHVCLSCDCPKNNLRDYVPPDKQYPRRDHNL